MISSLAQQTTIRHSLLLQALQKKVTAQVPFWLMRQAGRYLPEYRAVRQRAGSFLNLCFNPGLAAEVTLQPLQRFDMDAAILFSDILVVPYALGQRLDFIEGEGPRLEKLQNLHHFQEIDFAVFGQKLHPVYETIQRVRHDLAADKALIGFAGAPWTIACYMVQGYGDGQFSDVKERAFADPSAFDALIESLVQATAHYLIEQIKNGVDVVQIFDSWAGLLPEEYFSRWVIQPTRKIIDRIHRVYPGFPVIGFPRQAGALYVRYIQQSGVDGIGLDQDISIDDAVRDFGGGITLQGNLDPVILLAGGEALQRETRRILECTKGVPFIFNLGHGVIKETPPDNVALLAKTIRAYKR